jgi:hypothetical protein
MELDCEAELTFGSYQVELRLNKNVSSIVVVLAGIGSDFSKEPEFDFKGISGSLNHHSFIYIRDNSRSWYTNTNGWMSLVEFLQGVTLEIPGSTVTLLGSSMGGAGVLRLVKYIKAKRVIAISPRSTLKADFDIRNAEVVEAVENPELLDYLPATIGVEYIVLFSIDDYEDTLHAARLPFPSYWVRGGHNIAYTFKKLGLLEVFFRALCDNISSLESMGFYNSTISTFDCALRKSSELLDISACDESIIPEYLFDSWYQREIINYPRGHFSGHLFYPAHCLSRIAGAELRKYLFYGWSHLEEWGVWGIGPVHTIGFRLIENPSGIGIYVNISFTVFKPAPEYEQHIVVLLNGDCVFDGFLKDDRCMLSFSTSAKNNSIVILTKSHVSPTDFDIASDDRSLSVGIEEIFFKPMFRLE